MTDEPIPFDELKLVRAHAAELGASAGRVDELRRVVAGSGGLGISALMWGRASPSFVLLHGGAQNAHTWDKMLLRWNVDAVAVDLPGHGRSDWIPGSAYLPRDVAPILAPALHDWAPRHDAVIGMSLGGLVALRMAATGALATARLVLIDVTPGSTPERSKEIHDFLEIEEFESFEHLVGHTAGFRSSTPSDALRRSVLYNAVQLPDGRWRWRHDRTDPPGSPRLKRVYADLPTYWDDMPNVTCPVLLVLGERSGIVAPEHVERMGELIPQLRVITIAGSGHSVQSDAPIELARIIDSFVAET